MSRTPDTTLRLEKEELEEEGIQGIPLCLSKLPRGRPHVRAEAAAAAGGGQPVLYCSPTCHVKNKISARPTQGANLKSLDRMAFHFLTRVISRRTNS
jgi:hypothetical protein